MVGRDWRHPVIFPRATVCGSWADGKPLSSWYQCNGPLCNPVIRGPSFGSGVMASLAKHNSCMWNIKKPAWTGMCVLGIHEYARARKVALRKHVIKSLWALAGLFYLYELIGELDCVIMQMLRYLLLKFRGQITQTRNICWSQSHNLLGHSREQNMY